MQKITEAVIPLKYVRGVESQAKIMNDCEHSLPKDVHILDVGHNIGEVIQATAGSLKDKETLSKPKQSLDSRYLVARTADGSFNDLTQPEIMHPRRGKMLIGEDRFLPLDDRFGGLSRFGWWLVDWAEYATYAVCKRAQHDLRSPEATLPQLG